MIKINFLNFAINKTKQFNKKSQKILKSTSNNNATTWLRVLGRRWFFSRDIAVLFSGNCGAWNFCLPQLERTLKSYCWGRSIVVLISRCDSHYLCVENYHQLYKLVYDVSLRHLIQNVIEKSWKNVGNLRVFIEKINLVKNSIVSSNNFK